MNQEPKPEKIRNCPYCGQPRVIKSPFKELWRKPTLNEWIMLFILVMLYFISWAYQHDIGVCKDFVKNIDTVCLNRNPTTPPNYTSRLNITFNISSLNSINVSRLNSTIT